jgi:hypothetical protein
MFDTIDKSEIFVGNIVEITDVINGKLLAYKARITKITEQHIFWEIAD